MSSNSATKLPSQQSVKAFVETQLATKDALSELADTDDITEVQQIFIIQLQELTQHSIQD